MITRAACDGRAERGAGSRLGVSSRRHFRWGSRGDVGRGFDAGGWGRYGGEGEVVGGACVAGADLQYSSVGDERAEFRMLFSEPGADGCFGGRLYLGASFLATIKQFAGDESEIERTTMSSDMNEQTLREMYLAAFEAVVKRGQT